MNTTFLNRLQTEKWAGTKGIILFGYGRQGKRLYKTLMNDFNIIAIVENDINKCNVLTEEGVEILSFDSAISLMRKYKVIVTTAEYHYKDIKRQLESVNLVENSDFAMYQQFISEWYYKYKNKIYLLKTDIMVTPKCTLNCENCSQFVPYWEEKDEFDIDGLKSDLDNYFSLVDFVMDMNIVGGEPFLYQKLAEYIEYIGERYRNRIGYLGIITNGTVVPNDIIMTLLKKYDIGISISDYSKEINYKSKIDELCLKLEDKEISYVRNSEIQWFDFGYPRKVYKYELSECAKHMKNCNTICHCLNDGKVYYCGTAWAAEKSGMFPVDEKAFVDLSTINASSIEERRQIVECCLGNVKDGYIEFCRVCGGYGNDNDNRVITAKQMRRK